MSWLIETILDEGKQGPDHPKSLGMKNKNDFDSKKIGEEISKSISDKSDHDRGDRIIGDIKEKRDKNRAEMANSSKDYIYDKRPDLVDFYKKDPDENATKNSGRVAQAMSGMIRHKQRDQKRAVGEALEMIL